MFKDGTPLAVDNKASVRYVVGMNGVLEVINLTANNNNKSVFYGLTVQTEIKNGAQDLYRYAQLIVSYPDLQTDIEMGKVIECKEQRL